MVVSINKNGHTHIYEIHLLPCKERPLDFTLFLRLFQSRCKSSHHRCHVKDLVLIDVVAINLLISVIKD